MSQKSAEDQGLMRTHSVASQCIVLLRELASAHPNLKLPIGLYGTKDRPLDRICNFLMAELEGVRQDTGFDPSAGSTTSQEPPYDQSSEDKA
jgi:hypothetical protein